MQQQRDDKPKRRAGWPRPLASGRQLGNQDTGDVRDVLDYGETARSWGATSWPVSE